MIKHAFADPPCPLKFSMCRLLPWEARITEVTVKYYIIPDSESQAEIRALAKKVGAK